MDLPRVTEILRDAGLVDVTWFSEEARDRGTAVHLACQYHDEGALDEDSLVVEVAQRLDQWRRFLRDVDGRVLGVEMSVVNEALGYRGTLDRIIGIGGRYGILDIKGVSPSPWNGVQLAAYFACFPGGVAKIGAEEFQLTARWNVYLSADGYKFVERKSRDDWPAFKAALTLKNWRLNQCRKS